MCPCMHTLYRPLKATCICCIVETARTWKDDNESHYYRLRHIWEIVRSSKAAGLSEASGWDYSWSSQYGNFVSYSNTFDYDFFLVGPQSCQLVPNMHLQYVKLPTMTSCILCDGIMAVLQLAFACARDSLSLWCRLG